MQAGQKLSKHIKHEIKEADLERKLAHIEQFGPILVEKLVSIAGANEVRKKKAEEGLRKILGRDSDTAINELEMAQNRLAEQKIKEAKKAGISDEEIELVVRENKASSQSQKNVKKAKLKK